MASKFEFSKALMRDFPLLRNYQITSPDSPEYNCIAWAAADVEQWWWPSADPYQYWPPGVPKKATLAAFQAAFGTLGFEPCPDDSLELEFEKVALFADDASRITHAARQLPNGKWTSKMGLSHDIEHVLAEMEGGKYGRVIGYMRRRRSA